MQLTLFAQVRATSCEERPDLKLGDSKVDVANVIHKPLYFLHTPHLGPYLVNWYICAWTFEDEFSSGLVIQVF